MPAFYWTSAPNPKSLRSPASKAQPTRCCWFRGLAGFAPLPLSSHCPLAARMDDSDLDLELHPKATDITTHLAPLRTDGCWVCGQPASNKCSSCLSFGFEIRFCSAEHQRMVRLPGSPIGKPPHACVCRSGRSTVTSVDRAQTHSACPTSRRNKSADSRRTAARSSR